jgi:hypothetical protein
MAVDIIKISPESFRTLYLRRENRVILRSEAGRRIIVKRIIPEEWIPYRVNEFERATNDNKRNIQLIDRNLLSRIEKEISDEINE